jgi:DNA-binding NarL/FixJ family response regulator
VLSVDDEEFNNETVRRITAREGLVYVGSLVTADQLVRGVRQTLANMVVIDLNMPGKDPFEAIRELREADPDIHIVILSGERDPALVRRAFEVGADGFISKDETLEEIAAELTQVAHGERVLSPKLRQITAFRSSKL